MVFLLYGYLVIDGAYAIILSMSEIVVVDTSVIISALIGVRGPSREIIRQCLTGNYTPFDLPPDCVALSG